MGFTVRKHILCQIIYYYNKIALSSKILICMHMCIWDVCTPKKLKILKFLNLFWQKIEKICIPKAKNKRNLHFQCQKLKKNAFPVPKIKKICIPSTENEKKSILPMQKMQNICIANARIKKFALPKSKASGYFWGRYRLQKEIVSFMHLKGKNVFKIVSFSSMLKIKIICIPSAKNKKNLHSQCKK